MFKIKLVPLAVAAVLSLATLGVIGASSVAVAETDTYKSPKEIVATLTANTTVGQAASAAERHTGGRAMTAGLEQADGAYVYAVKTYTDNGVRRVFIDPSSGRVVRTDAENLLGKILDWKNNNAFAKAASLPITLSAAIQAAERQTGGQAIEASVDGDGNAVLFAVQVAKGRGLRSVFVDGASGRVVGVSGVGGDGDSDGD